VGVGIECEFGIDVELNVIQSFAFENSVDRADVLLLLLLLLRLAASEWLKGKVARTLTLVLAFPCSLAFPGDCDIKGDVIPAAAILLPLMFLLLLAVDRSKQELLTMDRTFIKSPDPRLFSSSPNQKVFSGGSPPTRNEEKKMKPDPNQETVLFYISNLIAFNTLQTIASPYTLSCSPEDTKQIHRQYQVTLK
jgi:hypothetical protein